MSLSFETERKIGSDDELLIADLKTQRTHAVQVIRSRERVKKDDGAVAGHEALKHLTEIANTTSVILTRMVRADCAVAIKLLWSRDDEIVIHTLVRDAKTQRERIGRYGGESAMWGPRTKQAIKDDFPYTDNTAFEQLVGNPSPSACFISNDLRALAARGEYKNSNEYWRHFYNCTGVAKITGPANVKGRGDVRTIGFLCVDSWSWPNDQKHGPIRDILLKVSRHVYNTLDLLVLPHTVERERKRCIGFTTKSGLLTALDADLQSQFQSNFERLHAQANQAPQYIEKHVVPSGPLSIVAAPMDHLSSTNGNVIMGGEDDDSVAESIAKLSPTRASELKDLQAALNKMSYEDVAAYLKPVANSNPYAKQLLDAAKRKKIIK